MRQVHIDGAAPLEIGLNVRHGPCHCWRMCHVERADRYKTGAVSFTLGADGDAHDTLTSLSRMMRWPRALTTTRRLLVGAEQRSAEIGTRHHASVAPRLRRWYASCSPSMHTLFSTNSPQDSCGANERLTEPVTCRGCDVPKRWADVTLIR